MAALALSLCWSAGTALAQQPADTGIASLDSGRAALAAKGLTYGLTYTSEILSNVSGGMRQGSVYQGKLEGFILADLEKIAGWTGLSFYANGFQIHGTGGIARDYVGAFGTISNIEAYPATRLSELWLERAFANDTFSIRFGQLTADTDFFISDYNTLFITSDWPAITKQNLPGGGPAYPLSTPGIRVKYQPDKQFTFLAALFNGDPATPGPGEPEFKNRHGLNFRVNDAPFAIAEMQYRFNQEADGRGLAGIWRFGGWHHFGKFDDQRYGSDGLPLAAPASNGLPRRFTGNSGVYAVIDQQIYRPPGGDANSGIGIYGRISASPSDRNLVNFYVDTGFTVSGLLPGRPNDKFGLDAVYSRISDRARGHDRDVDLYSGVTLPVRAYELILEASYLAQIAPGWTLQPDFQYIVYPGGRVTNPLTPGSNAPIRNAKVFGLRSVIKY